MAHYGLTKARSMGPVAEAVERAGGSIARVFRRAELPLQLIDEPERLILLRDQLYLVECAAREIGDEAFTARVATEGGIKFLGALGHRVSIAPSLDAAIVHCNALMTSQLQSATSLTLTISGGEARWTYRVTDPIATGRQKNEILALGYMLDLFRGFLGPGWTPIRADVPGLLAGRSANENVLRCAISQSDVAALVFPADLLGVENPRAPVGVADDESVVPDPDDLLACVDALVALALLDGRPRLDWLCRRLNLSRRSLQRKLAAQGVSFEEIVRRASFDRSAELLAQAGVAVTAIGYELGYSDAAHFTRAFRRWAGKPPRAWRRR
ncbi:MAG: helix-turn-helix domain-containing protein [Methylovirgula sp.]